MTKKDLLWVFDTPHYLEIYEPTLGEASKAIKKHEECTGMEFELVPDWEMYQRDHEETHTLFEKVEKEYNGG